MSHEGVAELEAMSSVRGGESEVEVLKSAPPRHHQSTPRNVAEIFLSDIIDYRFGSGVASGGAPLQRRR